MEMFPIGTGISEVRGIVRLIKESPSNSVPLYQLSHESEKEVDELIPTIEACRMLGFVDVGNGNLRLTKSGERLHINNFQSMIRSYLLKMEPFKTSRECIVKYGNLTTRELGTRLRKQGIVFRAMEKENDDVLRHLLLKWAVRCRVLEYDANSDRWRLS